MKNNIKSFGEFNENLNISEINLFIAEEGDAKLEVDENFLKQDNMDLLLRKLRRSGFSNLTGNFESKELIKQDDVYILELERNRKGGFQKGKQQIVFYRK